MSDIPNRPDGMTDLYLSPLLKNQMSDMPGVKSAEDWGKYAHRHGLGFVAIQTLIEFAEKIQLDAFNASQSATDNDWLSEIAKQWNALTGKPWDTLDGESRLEGMSANVTRLFELLINAGRRQGMTEAADVAESYKQMLSPTPTPERIKRAIETARDNIK